MRTKWKVIPDSPEDKTLKIYFDGNQVVNNRKAHIAYSGLT
jgi:outer membrane protein assembly factor BamE (lipoprotein component of BamABCDE complex)